MLLEKPKVFKAFSSWFFKSEEEEFCYKDDETYLKCKRNDIIMVSYVKCEEMCQSLISFQATHARFDLAILLDHAEIVLRSEWISREELDSKD